MPTNEPDSNATILPGSHPNGVSHSESETAKRVQSDAARRFRILRPHAQGGLGKVSVARDLELNREVAFKEIRFQYADDESARARFLLEAEVTGGLEHPSIVPVYGMGCFPDGRPYYAMRFIRGESLQDVVDKYHQANAVTPDERSVELRGLLQFMGPEQAAGAYRPHRTACGHLQSRCNALLHPDGSYVSDGQDDGRRFEGNSVW